MEIPWYLLPRPPGPDAPTRTAFDDLLAEALAAGPGEPIDYRLDAPRWQFLCHVAGHRGFVLHGSGNPDIAEFEPRQSNDVYEFGNRRAIYAASDGLWPMYFAILDRDRYVTSLVNSCVRFESPDGAASEPYYFFSINQDALGHSPWQRGVIYLLPADTFEAEEPHFRNGSVVRTAQVASLVPVRPAAKLLIEPEDFPYLNQIRGHDLDTVVARSSEDPSAFPWLDDPDESGQVR